MPPVPVHEPPIGKHTIVESYPWAGPDGGYRSVYYSGRLLALVGDVATIHEVAGGCEFVKTVRLHPRYFRG
jgi:hypothetical protein